MSKRFVVIFLSFLASVAGAQDLSETLEIRITNLDVVVTDARGRPVRGLQKEDFELYENGRRVEIANFFEESAEVAMADAASPSVTPSEPAAAPVVRRPRRVVVFIDQTTLMPNDVNRAVEDLKRFLPQIASEGDRVMVAVWNDSFRIAHPFSADLSAVHQSLDSVKGNAAMALSYARRFSQLQESLNDMIVDGESMDPPLPPDYAMGLAEVRTYAEELTQRQRRMIQTLESLASSMAGLEGRKAIVLLTAGATMYPGREAFVYFDNIKHEFAGGAGQQPRSESGHFRLTREFEAAIRRANSAGVSIHALRGSSLSADMVGADARPLSPSVVAAAGIAGSESESDRVVSMSSLASETGGIMVNGSNDLGDALARIEDDFSSYYSLGYRSGPQSDGSRKIEVRVRREGARVRHRTAIVDRSIDDEMQQRLTSALAYPELGLGMSLRASADTVAPGEAGRITVPVTITIPTSELTLLPEGDDLLGTFQVFTAFMRGSGAVSKVKAMDQGFRFPAESRARRKSITLKLDVDIDPETERIAVGIVDGPSQMSGVTVLDIAKPRTASR